jgi:CubicO group peptidase (beta-lactamase class C family)
VWSIGAAVALPSLDPILNPIRHQHHLPALAAAVVVDGKVVAAGAVGVRKEGSSRRVRLSDRWHIGSCTKSMTASLAALLIQEGRLQWESPMEELFPDLRAEMRAEWRSATLEQLLKNQAGAPASLEANGLWRALWRRHAFPGPEQRSFLARELLVHQVPEVPAGTQFLYSNAGFALAGHALEEKLQSPWEALLVKRITRPLGLRSVGFGCTASTGKLNGPWGHHRDDTGVNVPDEPGPNGDNPAAIGPGGTVHCTILDLARYAGWHLRGARGQGTLLRPETFSRLHQPYQGGGATTYAGGWNVVPRAWGDGEVLTHNGSNTKNFAVIWIAPKRNFAVVVCSNLGGDIAAQATDETAAALIRKYLTQGE